MRRSINAVQLTFLLVIAGSTCSARHKNDPAMAQLWGKEWIGPAGEYLRMLKDTTYIFTPDFGGGRHHAVYAEGYLTLIDTIISSRYPAWEEYDSFRMQVQDGKVILQALNKTAFLALRTMEPVAFTVRERLTDSQFSFEKIFYGGGGGYTSSKAWFSLWQISIDSSGGVLFSCIKRSGPYNGTYKSQLNETQLGRLKKLAQFSTPDVWTTIANHAEDAGNRTLQLNYNNKRSITGGKGFPHTALELESFLGDLPATLKMEKISDKYGLTE